MEELIPILVIVAYAVLSLLGRLAKKAKGQEAEADVDAGQEPSTVDRMLRDMMRQAGIEPEPPVPGEHRPTLGEHRTTAPEHHQAAPETYATASEHERTRTETRLTPSEQAPRLSDHLRTPGEHLKGDVFPLPPIPKLRPPRGRRQRSRFADAVVADLGSAKKLGRAIVLREILGPPVSLRPPDEQG
jgi:hypothetical protein